MQHVAMEAMTMLPDRKPLAVDELDERLPGWIASEEVVPLEAVLERPRAR